MSFCTRSVWGSFDNGQSVVEISRPCFLKSAWARSAADCGGGREVGTLGGRGAFVFGFSTFSSVFTASGLGAEAVAVAVEGPGAAAVGVDDDSAMGVEGDDFDLVLPGRMTFRIDDVRRLRIDLASVGSDIVGEGGGWMRGGFSREEVGFYREYKMLRNGIGCNRKQLGPRPGHRVTAWPLRFRSEQ